MSRRAGNNPLTPKNTAMENTATSRSEQLSSFASRYVKGYGSYPNPEDPDPHPWPFGPLVRNAWKSSLLTYMAQRDARLWEIINGPGPQPWAGPHPEPWQYGPVPDPWLRPGPVPWKVTFARSFAQEVIDKAQLIQYSGESANGSSDHSGGSKFIYDITDELCPPPKKVPPRPKFDELDLFVIGLEFKQAAEFIRQDSLKTALLTSAGKLIETGINLSNG